MSGIFGLVNHDGAPVNGDDLRRMAGILVRRGPEGTRVWNSRNVGFGHTLLATTPEALHERLPLTHSDTGCVITADARLDNRDELLDALGLREHASSMGDGQLILSAYLAWGQACVDGLASIREPTNSAETKPVGTMIRLYPSRISMVEVILPAVVSGTTSP